VAGDDDGHAVCAVGVGYGSHGAGFADAVGLLLVAHGFAVGNGLQGLPHGSLKRGGGRVQGNAKLGAAA